MSTSKELGQAADRLNQVVENLLDMSRIESGHLQLNYEVFSIHDLVDHVLQRMSSYLLKHEVKVNYGQYLEFNDLIRGDFRLLDHAIGNLILNATNYSPLQSEIKLEVQTNGAEVVLTISDQGPGIGKEFRDRVFEKFFRVPGTPAGGVGLGLSIVKGLLDAHNASIRLLDTMAGAAFEIRFPKAQLPDKIKSEHS